MITMAYHPLLIDRSMSLYEASLYLPWFTQIPIFFFQINWIRSESSNTKFFWYINFSLHYLSSNGSSVGSSMWVGQLRLLCLLWLVRDILKLFEGRAVLTILLVTWSCFLLIFSCWFSHLYKHVPAGRLLLQRQIQSNNNRNIQNYRNYGFLSCIVAVRGEPPCITSNVCISIYYGYLVDYS